ncbi:MAG TPA: MFS transporter [Verrucomicrobiae bacterium]|nr:MFS transporter [Verrucomicrobiae bacterium]
MNRASGFFPWLVWSLAALFVVFNYVQQVVPNVIAADLAQSFNATASTLGNIAACYFYAYAILQIPVGLIVDRYGTRWPLTLAVLMAGLGTLAFSQAHNSGMAQVARFIMGASAAFSFIGCLKVVQAWFPPSKFSTLAGMTNTAGMIGAAGGAPVATLVQHFGWRGTVAWMGGAELLLAVLVFAFVRDGAAGANLPAPASTPAVVTGGMAGLLKNPQVWINAIYATSISLVFVAFGGLWGTSYIQKVYSLDAIAAAGTGSILFIGGIVGSLFFGWISDYVGRRKPPMVLAGVGALASMVCMLYIPGIPLIGFKVGLFLVGVFSSANIISYAVARDLYPRLAGFSIGFLSTCYFAGSAASQPLVGLLLEHAGSGAEKTGGLAALTPGDYRFALSPLAIFMLVGLIASLLLRETLAAEPHQKQ